MNRLLKNTLSQSNHNITVVKVTPSCATQCKRRKKRPCNRRKRPSKQNVCINGDIFQPCPSPPTVYYRAVHVHPYAIVRVQNDSACMMIAQFYTRAGCPTACQKIAQGQQVTVAIPRLRKMTIRCKEDHDGDKMTGICRGRYDIQLRG